MKRLFRLSAWRELARVLANPLRVCDEVAELKIIKQQRIRAESLASRLVVQNPGLSSSIAEPKDETSIPEGNALWRHFQENTNGPGIWKWTHYFDAYQRHLGKFVGKNAHLAEIGIYSGGSLPMWRAFLGPNSRVTGIDIEGACKKYQRDGITVRIGDQGDRAFWRRFRESSEPLDILIDDGGHLPEQQRITLEETLDFIKPGGVYICEDIHGVGNGFAHYVYALADQINALKVATDAKGLSSNTTPFQKVVKSISIYPYMVVLEKNDAPVRELLAPRHGTEWEPFL